MQRKTQQQQRGGTFLGLIAGLVVGLAVALAVAVYVTNIPVPFLHKAASRMPIQDEAEAARNQGWDPNASLRGDHSSEPAPESGAPSQLTPPAVAGGSLAPAPEGSSTPPASVATQTPAPASSLPSTPASRPVPESGNAPSNAHSTAVQTTPDLKGDPLGALVAARTAPGAVGGHAASAPAASNMIYFVQAGAFTNNSDADAQRARLSLSGVQAQVSSVANSGRTVYRVRVGPFTTQGSAQQVQTRLQQDGFDVALIRAQR